MLYFIFYLLGLLTASTVFFALAYFFKPPAEKTKKTKTEQQLRNLLTYDGTARGQVIDNDDD